MGSTNIQQLNYYCLFEILKHIEVNCKFNEIPNSDVIYKYEDLINFVISCSLFRTVFKECNRYLYGKLQIEKFYFSPSVYIYMNFYDLNERLQHK